MKKLIIAILVILASLPFVSAGLDTYVGFPGSVQDVNSNLSVPLANISVNISTQNSCKVGVIYNETFVNGVEAGVFSVLLGVTRGLGLQYNKDYWSCININNGSHSETFGADIFRGGQGLIGIEDVNQSEFFVGGLDLFLHNASSADVSNHFLLTSLTNDTDEKTMVRTIDGTQSEIKNWTTASGVPSIPLLSAGVYSVHLHARKTVGGAKDTRIQVKLWRLTSGGVYKLVSEFEESNLLTTDFEEYVMHMTISDEELNTTDRLTLQVNATTEGAGANPVVELQYEGHTSSRLSIPSVSISIENFVPYTGAVRNVDLGNKNATANSFFGNLFGNWDGLEDGTSNGQMAYWNATVGGWVAINDTRLWWEENQGLRINTRVSTTSPLYLDGQGTDAFFIDAGLRMIEPIAGQDSPAITIQDGDGKVFGFGKQAVSGLAFLRNTEGVIAFFANNDINDYIIFHTLLNKVVMDTMGTSILYITSSGGSIKIGDTVTNNSVWENNTGWYSYEGNARPYTFEQMLTDHDMHDFAIAGRHVFIPGSTIVTGWQFTFLADENVYGKWLVSDDADINSDMNIWLDYSLNAPANPGDTVTWLVEIWVTRECDDVVNLPTYFALIQGADSPAIGIATHHETVDMSVVSLVPSIPAGTVQRGDIVHLRVNRVAGDPNDYADDIYLMGLRMYKREIEQGLKVPQ